MATAAAYDRRTALQPAQRIPQVPLPVIALARGEEGVRLGPGEQELGNLRRRVDHEPVAGFHRLYRAMGKVSGDSCRYNVWELVSPLVLGNGWLQPGRHGHIGDERQHCFGCIVGHRPAVACSEAV